MPEELSAVRSGPPTEDAPEGERVDALAEALQALEDADADALQGAGERIAAQSLFLYAFIGDSLRHGERLGRQGALRPRAALRLKQTIESRVASLSNWSRVGNETVEAIERGAIAADAIKPHLRGDARTYADYYEASSHRAAAQVAPEVPTTGAQRPLDHLKLNVNHLFRQHQAIAAVEALFTLCAEDDGELGTGGHVRWLDIGCGTGDITNAVDPVRARARSWEITGADFQTGRIAYAEARKAEGRSFVVADALQVLADARAEGRPYQIASMFEFLEHLDDPLALLRRLYEVGPRFVIAGSPLGQILDRPNAATIDPVHLWSFTRQGWEQMFALAGFTPIFCSEARVGGYLGGLDWLTMVCGPLEEVQARRVEWRHNPPLSRAAREHALAEEDQAEED